MTLAIGLFLAIVLIFAATAFKGAPYIPTHKASLDVLFNELIDVSSDDLLIDIGSGDGVVLRMAASRGARTLGYEINPLMVVVSKLLSLKYGKCVRVELADFWKAKFPEATTIVYTFGESRDIQKMFDKVQSEATRLNKTLRFVSYGFTSDSHEPIASKSAMTVYAVAPLQ